MDVETFSTMLFKVDHRETKLKDFFDKCKEFDEEKIQVVYENLVYGDFQICQDDETPIFIFERKEVADLLASIKDGRYKNQKAKLFTTFLPSQIFYIIEGSVKFKTNAQPTQKMIQSAIINTMLRDKIGVFRTQDLQETYDLLVGIVLRYHQEPTKYSISAQTIDSVTVVQSSVNDDPSKVFKCMLCQIPNVNDKTANELSNRWQSLATMMGTLSPLPIEEREAYLSAIKVNNRKISKRVVQNLLTYLF